MRLRKETVAVIGAGPGGLVAARYLKAHGFQVVIYEAAGELGGQWNATAERSAIWPGLRANTSRVTTRFSDLDYPAETAAFPAGADVLAYLRSFAETFDLVEGLRLNTEIETIARHPAGGWVIHSRKPGTPPRTEIFDRVIVASGRYATPTQPEVAGLAHFSGAVSHSSDYCGVEAFRSQTVVVAGASASALEIASELADAGVAVIVTMRRRRAVVRNAIGDSPREVLAGTRFGAWADDILPFGSAAAELQALVAASAPAGAADEIGTAGIAISDRFLDRVADGSVAVKPWMPEVADGRVHFADGTTCAADAIIFCTGFSADLPFLDQRTRAILGCGVSGKGPDLDDFTFHPDLPGMAFVGLFTVAGASFPALELQARWIAYGWAGLAPLPSSGEMRAAMLIRARRDRSEAGVRAHVLTLRFARLAGVEPDPAAWPALARALVFGPVSPASFRLSGPDALSGAAADVMTDAARFGITTDPVLTDAERLKLQAMIAAGRADLAPILRQPGPEKARKAA